MRSSNLWVRSEPGGWRSVSSCSPRHLLPYSIVSSTQKTISQQRYVPQKILTATLRPWQVAYDGTWRDADPAEVQKKIDAGETYTYTLAPNP